MLVLITLSQPFSDLSLFHCRCNLACSSVIQCNVKNTVLQDKEETRLVITKLKHVPCECGCSENIGENVIYLWVEGVREFVQSRQDGNSETSGVDRMAAQRQEESVTPDVGGGDLTVSPRETEADEGVEGEGEEEVEDWKFYEYKKDNEGKVAGEIYSVYCTCVVMFHAVITKT